jgi:hypothetical protein
LKAVLAGNKKLLKMAELRPINAPFYDEISVKNIYPRVKDDTTVSQYLPDNLPAGRQLDRTFFFNVLHTLHPDFVKGIISHAQRLRNTADDDTKKGDFIKVSAEWQTQLEALPFVSSKSCC